MSTAKHHPDIEALLPLGLSLLGLAKLDANHGALYTVSRPAEHCLACRCVYGSGK